MRNRLWILAAASLFAARISSSDLIVTDAGDAINPACDLSGNTLCSLRDALIKAQAIDGWSIHFADRNRASDDQPHEQSSGHHHAGIHGRPNAAGIRGSTPHRDSHADAGNATHGLHFGSAPMLTGRRGDEGARDQPFRRHVCGLRRHHHGQSGGNFIQICYIGTDATGMTATETRSRILDNTLGGNTYRRPRPLPATSFRATEPESTSLEPPRLLGAKHHSPATTSEPTCSAPAAYRTGTRHFRG